MIDDDEPNLVTSGKSKRIVVDGYSFSIDIFRLETDKTWTLEVVDHNNTSHVWEEQFESDAVARDLAVKTIEAEGALRVHARQQSYPLPSNLNRRALKIALTDYWLTNLHRLSRRPVRRQWRFSLGLHYLGPQAGHGRARHRREDKQRQHEAATHRARPV